MPPWEVAVIGGGPAGLLAGIGAGRAGARTLLLEKKERPGRKLALTGGGRCNFTNTLEPREFVARFGDRKARHLGRALALLPGRELRALLARHGVEGKLEREIRLYCSSGKAEQVVEALIRELEQSGASLSLGRPILDVRPTRAGFRLAVAGGESLETRSLILCTGGLSYPETGSTGDGHRWAEALGHEVTPLRPGLVGLKTLEEWPRSLAGLVLSEVEVSLSASEGGKALGKERAELLFTHSGLSGPAVTDLSLVLSGSGLDTGRISLDFCPGKTLQEVEALVEEACRAHPRRGPARALTGLLPGRLLEHLTQSWEGPAGGLARRARAEWAGSLRKTKLTVTSLGELQRAEVTVGGLSWADVDSATLESRRVPGLFFAGELLDLAGRCGGFNLQAAFSTGYLAGSQAAARARNESSQSREKTPTDTTPPTIPG